MKSGQDKGNQNSITQPLLQDLKDREALDSAKANPVTGSDPLKPASLYEDAGSGYNSNFTFPQD